MRSKTGMAATMNHPVYASFLKLGINVFRNISQNIFARGFIQGAHKYHLDHFFLWFTGFAAWPYGVMWWLCAAMFDVVQLMLTSCCRCTYYEWYVYTNVNGDGDITAFCDIAFLFWHETRQVEHTSRKFVSCLNRDDTDSHLHTSYRLMSQSNLKKLLQIV